MRWSAIVTAGAATNGVATPRCLATDKRRPGSMRPARRGGVQVSVVSRRVFIETSKHCGSQAFSLQLLATNILSLLSKNGHKLLQQIPRRITTGTGAYNKNLFHYRSYFGSWVVYVQASTGGPLRDSENLDFQSLV